MEAELLQVPTHCKLAWYIKKGEYESFEFNSLKEALKIFNELFECGTIEKARYDRFCYLMSHN